MNIKSKFKIAAFYKFIQLADLEAKKSVLKSLMEAHDVTGTIIIASEGFNASVTAQIRDLDGFLSEMGEVLGPLPDAKFSFDEERRFARRKVKIKQEIVTLKRNVDINLADGTHVSPAEWNDLIMEPDTIVLDARNDYEFKVGTFEGAIDPGIESFSELPGFIESNFDASRNTKIAMFCTGGIRCEKLAPLLIEKGFKQVFQLDGGILRYLEEVDSDASLWKGECFVFDERVSLRPDLKRGKATDFSSRKKSAQTNESDRGSA